LFDDVRNFREIEILGIGSVDEIEYFGKMSDNIWVIEYGIGLNGLL